MAIPGVPIFAALAGGNQPLQLFDTAFLAVQAYILAHLPFAMTDEGPFQSGVNFTPGVTTSIALSQAYQSNADVIVHFDGVFQGYDTYSLSGVSLIFNNPIPVGVQTVYVVGGVTTTAPSTNVPSGSVRPTPTSVGQEFIDLTLGPYGQLIYCGQVSPAIWCNSAGVPV